MARRLRYYFSLRDVRVENSVHAGGQNFVQEDNKTSKQVFTAGFVAFLLLIGFVSYGQTTSVRYVLTEPNGVKVYESAGNEGVRDQDYSVPVTKIPVKKEIEDFNLSECKDALYHIENKIEVVKSLPDNPDRKERLDTYEKGRKRVLDRIEVLTSNTH